MTRVAIARLAARGGIDVDPRSPGAETVGEAAHPRIYQLDAIRGVLAIGVMGYHVLHWPEAFGTWGVYAFFVLSGYALDLVYRGRFELRSFAVARIARLAPLWIPVVLVSAIAYGMTDPGRLLLNLTGAFGFVHPGATSIVTGGWSIGIEVVCYVAFVLLVRLSTPAIAVLTVAAAVLRLVWVGGLMPVDLVASWVQYTEAPSFLVFFVAGILASRARLFRTEWSGWPARAATWLGDASYGTYLLHPLVAMAIGPIALLVTPPLAWAVRRGYEIPTGRRLKLALQDLDHRHARQDVPVVQVQVAALVVGDPDLERVRA